MEPGHQPFVYHPGHFFRKRFTATWAFTVGILLFFLPFSELKCSSITIAGNTGIGLAMGKEWKMATMGKNNDLFNGSDSNIIGDRKGAMKAGPSIFALLAIAAGILGILFSLSELKLRAMISMSAGILGAAMLIALMIQLKLLLRSSMPGSGGKSESNLNISRMITVQFTIWYYLSLISFLTAAFFGFKHHQIELQDNIDQMLDFEFQERKGDG